LRADLPTASRSYASVLRAADIGDEERAYGGDGWTIEQYKAHVDRFEWSRVTQNQADAVLERVLKPGNYGALNARRPTFTG
jgi:hypothetical protein